MVRDICLMLSLALAFIGFGRLDTPETALRILVISLALGIVVTIVDRLVGWMLRRLRPLLMLTFAAGIVGLLILVEPLRASLLRDPYTPLVLSVVFLIGYGVFASGRPTST